MNNTSVNYLYYSFVERVGTLSSKLSKQGKFPKAAFVEVRQLVDTKDIYKSFVKSLYRNKNLDEYSTSLLFDDTKLNFAKNIRNDVLVAYNDYCNATSTNSMKDFLDYYSEDVVVNMIFKYSKEVK